MEEILNTIDSLKIEEEERAQLECLFRRLFENNLPLASLSNEDIRMLKDYDLWGTVIKNIPFR